MREESRCRKRRVLLKLAGCPHPKGVGMIERSMSALRILIVFLAATQCAAAAGITVFDFEDGTLQGWRIVSGEAGTLPTGPETARQGVDFGRQGSYFIGTYENPRRDEAQIVLQSPVFTVRSRTISLLVGGGFHPGACYVALYRASDDSEVRLETGRNTETMDRRYWDVESLIGTRVYLKIVDSHTGGWGHINVDDIRELSAEEEQARAEHLARREERYRRWLAGVDAPSKKIVYSGDTAGDVAMPLGGIGSGHVSICGDGAVRQWQIFNRVNDACVVPDSFFAIRAKAGSGRAVCRLLRQSPVGDLPHVRRVEFVGEYPVAELTFEDSDLPVSVKMRTFSPHIPMNSKDSAIPAAVFEFAIENRGRETVEVSLLSTLQNAAGYDGVSAIHGVWNRAYGGNVNSPLSLGSLRGVVMSNPLLKRDARQFGTMALGAMSRNAAVTAQWSDPWALWRDFCADGEINTAGRVGPSKPGHTWNAAITVPLTLRPSQRAVVPFIWTWSFPNNYVWWDDREGQPRIGRMYSNWFEDAGKALEYVAANYRRLAADTELFRRTFYKTTLPYWMLGRISAQSSTLASQVCMWLEDGTFAGFEGSGCCPMNCAHVWNYEQQMAFLFPTLERNMRRTDLFVQQMENGAVRHRTRLPVTLPRESGPFVDGHLGTILKCYREYRMCADGDWLDEIWPRIKRAMEFVLNEWDPNQDGVLVNEQWNTYDAAMYGPNTFIGALYLCALRAAEEMARAQDDAAFARRLRSVFEIGRERLDQACWNGEYYWQIHTKPSPEEVGEDSWLLQDWPAESADPHVNRPYGKGCHADQLLGQWWANILDLGYLLPKERFRCSLDAIMRYNWVTDFGEAVQTPRGFAGDGDPGLYNCTWPRGGRPANETLYSYEVWTGIEYEVAGLLMSEGKTRDACRIVKAVSDRYNGAARPPIPRNPWAEVECGNHYARAMSSWGLLLAAQGYSYHGPEGALGFDPVMSPEDHASFFSTAEGWGLFTQKRGGNTQTNTLELEYGHLDLRRLTLRLQEGIDEASVTVVSPTSAGQARASGGVVVVEFQTGIRLRAGDRLTVRSIW